MQLLSICLPTYNRFDLVIQQLERLRFENPEVVMVIIRDNASDDPRYTDDLTKYIHRHPLKIRLVRNSKNLGPVENFRLVVKDVETPYAALIADDDYWKGPTVYTDVAQYMFKERLDYAYGSSRFRYDVDDVTARTGDIYSFEFTQDRVKNFREFLYYHSDVFVYGFYSSPLLVEVIHQIPDRWALLRKGEMKRVAYVACSYLFLNCANISQINVEQGTGVKKRELGASISQQRGKCRLSPRLMVRYLIGDLQLSLKYIAQIQKAELDLIESWLLIFLVVRSFCFDNNPLFGEPKNRLRMSTVIDGI